MSNETMTFLEIIRLNKEGIEFTYNTVRYKLNSAALWLELGHNRWGIAPPISVESKCQLIESVEEYKVCRYWILELGKVFPTKWSSDEWSEVGEKAKLIYTETKIVSKNGVTTPA